ncbi:unnamed protein product [Malus baccata var. baccata]
MAITVVPIVLNRKNYDDWSSRIKTYLLAKDLWDVVHLETEDKENAQSRAWKKKDAKALYAIQNSCGDDTYKLIKDKTTAKEAWDTLYQKLKPGANSDNGETFVNYVVSLKWNDAIKFLCDHPDAGSAIISDGGTALHYAIWNLRSCSARIIEQLVGLMTREDLQIKDSNGLTALHHLIRCYPERVEVAESMVKKNRKLLTILDSEETPLVVEAQSREKGERMANYLFSETPPETLEVTDAAQLISLGFRLERFDIVLWDLIQHYPKLVMVKDYNGDFPLITLANDIKNEKGQNLLQIAAECRQRQVFDLIYVLYDELKEQRKYGKDQFDRIRDRVGKKDHFGNNMLHTVACISSLSKIDHTQGAALQMQRELQWFKVITYPSKFMRLELEDTFFYTHLNFDLWFILRNFFLRI